MERTMLLKFTDNVAPLPAANPLPAAAASRAHRGGGAANTRTPLLALYLEGWVEANAGKIFAASAPGYRLDDPLVGQYSRWSLPLYLEQLRVRFANTGPIATRDLSFLLRRQSDSAWPYGDLHFFREVPRLGLSGVAIIRVGARGITAESVSYDLNLASDVLRASP
jgi:hypothetical protein